MYTLKSSWTTIGIVLGALLSAPCFVGIMLIPFGLGALMMSSFFMFLDSYRSLFMLLSLALLGVAHYGLRYARQFRPTRLIWGVTILALLLIAGELIVDPPWNRHALVPM